VSSMTSGLVTLVVSALVVGAVSRPAGLGARGSVFLVGAGLVTLPLYLLPSLLLGDYRPSQPLAITIVIALAGGLIAGIWPTLPRQPNTREEAGVRAG
jgi:hypothetical protein